MNILTMLRSGTLLDKKVYPVNDTATLK